MKFKKYLLFFISSFIISNQAISQDAGSFGFSKIDEKQWSLNGKNVSCESISPIYDRIRLLEGDTPDGVLLRPDLKPTDKLHMLEWGKSDFANFKYYFEKCDQSRNITYLAYSKNVIDLIDSIEKLNHFYPVYLTKNHHVVNSQTSCQSLYSSKNLVDFFKNPLKQPGLKILGKQYQDYLNPSDFDSISEYSNKCYESLATFISDKKLLKKDDFLAAINEAKFAFDDIKVDYACLSSAAYLNYYLMSEIESSNAIFGIFNSNLALNPKTLNDRITLNNVNNQKVLALFDLYRKNGGKQQTLGDLVSSPEFKDNRNPCRVRHDR